jgi:hypothetical protein
MTTKATTGRKLRWTAGKFAEGPFEGPFWGAKLGDTFLMIVPRAATKKAPAYFELWTNGIVHDETKSKTLAEAQDFAERSLGNILSGKFPSSKKAASRKAA